MRGMAPTQTTLAIGGMTCASCANRVERRLSELDGVSATVNLATEKAAVTYADPVTVDDLVAAVESTGYTATPPADEPGSGDVPAAHPPTRFGPGCWSVPCFRCRSCCWPTVPAWQFDYWGWVSLALATPVVCWGAWPFHVAAWTNLRHGATTMDTLVSMGVLAAYGWSVYALFWGTAGEPGMTHPFELTIERGDAASRIYLEVAAAVTTFLLAGRFLEARAKRIAGAALRSMLELGDEDVAVLRDGRWRAARADRDLVRGRPVRGTSRREGRDRRCRHRGRVGRGPVPGDRRVRARRRRGGLRRDRCDGQRRRSPGRTRHPGRCRHPARADGAPGRGGAH